MKRKSASLTVEAAFILPIFIYVIVAFLYFIQIIIIQENIQSAITQVGNYLSKYAYVYHYIEEYKEDSSSDQVTNKTESNELNKEKEMKDIELDKENEINKVKEINKYSENSNIKKELSIAKAIDSIFIKYKTKEFLNETSINQSCIVNGFSGMDFFLSSFMKENDEVDIIVTYKIRLPILFFSIQDMRMVQRVKLRGWTGYDEDASGHEYGNSDKTEKSVYITQTGTVYHSSNECTHLKLSIKNTSYTEVRDLRNNYGGKYRLCELCGEQNISLESSLYITDTGDRYHFSLDCSGLKRSIIIISMKEVGNRTPCTRCTKEN